MEEVPNRTQLFIKIVTARSGPEIEEPDHWYHFEFMYFRDWIPYMSHLLLSHLNNGWLV